MSPRTRRLCFQLWWLLVSRNGLHFTCSTLRRRESHQDAVLDYRPEEGLAREFRDKTNASFLV